LILDLLKEEDPRKLYLGISVIEASYPETDQDWFIRLKETLQAEAEIKISNELLQQFNDLSIKQLEMQIAFESELKNIGQSDPNKTNLRTKTHEKELQTLDFERKKVEKLLDMYQINTDNLQNIKQKKPVDSLDLKPVGNRLEQKNK